VAITPKDDETLDFAALRPALWSEGLRAGRIRIVADGRVESDGSSPRRFRIAGWPAAFPIAGDAPEEGPARIRADVELTSGEPRLRILSR